jgi:hypothetical protein
LGGRKTLTLVITYRPNQEREREMRKPIFLTSKSFQITDHRRGQDYKDTQFTELLVFLKDNAEKWEELISLVLEDNEFDTPPHLSKIDVRLMGRRQSFAGRAHRTKGYIKLTPKYEDYHDESLVEIFIHELAHIAVPTEHRNGRRVIHGRKFKATAYKIAQYAAAIGLISEENVKYSIGNATIENISEAAQTVKEEIAQNRFIVGQVVRWEYSGHKHGGTYTGRIKRVNKKTYTVEELTRNGSATYGRQLMWKLPIMRSNQYTLVK